MSDAEWRAPTFRCAFGDCADFGVELETACGRLFTVSWDPPGWHERIWLSEGPLAVLDGVESAIWDVSRAGRWDRFIGQEVSGVTVLTRRGFASDDGALEAPRESVRR